MASKKTTTSMAAQLEKRVSLEILRGQRAPGSNLPPVRTLASQLETTVPTIQRVVDRLEASGLVTTRRGSGVTVNDPHVCGELTLLPLWLEALADDPVRMGEILSDFLELRRVMTAHLIRTRSGRIAKAANALVEIVARVGSADDTDALAQADLEFSRIVLRASGQFAATALFHTSEVLVGQVPHLPEALYGDSKYYRRVLEKMIRAFAAPDGADKVAEVQQAWDERTIARFLALHQR